METHKIAIACDHAGFQMKEFLKKQLTQQGFEIICKENAELKGEADSVLNNWCKGDDPCPHLKKRDEQLTKAKEIIKHLINSLIVIDGEEIRELSVVKEAERLLNSENI